jgi:hypothetical protein
MFVCVCVCVCVFLSGCIHKHTHTYVSRTNCHRLPPSGSLGGLRGVCIRSEVVAPLSIGKRGVLPYVAL